MIRVVMFDLGDTLVDAELRPFADVPQALAAVGGMRSADGKRVKTCIVSDWTLAEPPLPATPARVKPLVDQFFARFDGTGLRPLFEPVAKRVTLSTQAGAMKPARAVFEKALARLGAGVGLEACLFITESAAHVKAARQQLGMHALRFRSAAGGTFDFDAWAQAPALVAHGLGADHDHASGNLLAAARLHLSAQGVELDALEPAAKPGRWVAQGRAWHPVTLPGPGATGPVQVSVPVRAQVQRTRGGALKSRVEPPTPEALTEATSFAASLARHGDLGTRPTASHALQTAPDGRQRLVRRGFRAF